MSKLSGQDVVLIVQRPCVVCGGVFECKPLPAAKIMSLACFGFGPTKEAITLAGLFEALADYATLLEKEEND